MKDIKNVDSRLNNVEYVVALNTVEKATINTTIVDQYGIPVTKSGFLVDNFANHDITDITNPDCKIFIDGVNGVAKALQTLDGVTLIEPPGTTTTSRASNGYQLTGNTISLPYTEAPMISQTLASTAEYVQAFAAFDFIGQLSIYPSTDAYVDNVYNTIITNSVAAPVTNTINTTVQGQPPVIAVASSAGSILDPLGIFGGGGGSIICTKMKELGLLSDELYKLDTQFGENIINSNKDIYDGYIYWAKVVVEWLNHTGKSVAFVNDTKRDVLILQWVSNLVKIWSNEMANEMGANVKSTIIGKVLMKCGLFTCNVIGKFNKKFNININKELSTFEINLLFVLILLVNTISKLN
jgi:hypothetical protein